jgi:quercetin dioxygenase-like cupin family protein
VTRKVVSLPPRSIALRQGLRNRTAKAGLFRREPVPSCETFAPETARWWPRSMQSGISINLPGKPANDMFRALGRYAARPLAVVEESMRTTILLTLFSALAVPAMAMDHHGTVQADGLTWSAPAAYAPGAQLAVVKGDPTKEGQYVVRLKVPAGYKIAAHTHPNDENVTVLSGSFNIGTGDKLDETKGVLVKAGGYSYVAKGMTHYAWFTEDTILQLHGTGPQGVTYVNPADDPRKK